MVILFEQKLQSSNQVQAHDNHDAHIVAIKQK